jgi:hypothetical protein
MNKKKETSVKSTKKVGKKKTKQELDEDDLPCIDVQETNRFDPSARNCSVPDDFNCEPDYDDTMGDFEID